MNQTFRIADWPAPAIVRTRPESRLLTTAIVFALWALLVAVGVSHHEFWRDEVRALSLALRGDSLLAIPDVVHGEGHPFLWYILLRAAHDLTGSVLVLPAVSVLVAAAAVLLFLQRAPFALWLRCLFVFCGLPLYEYSVMARNYGISMLLMFLFAVVYTRDRRSPLLLGVILFLLANTNVHSAALVPLLVLVWLSDWWVDRNTPARVRETGVGVILGAAIALAGIVVCFFSVYPSVHDLITAQHSGQRGLADAIWSIVVNPGSLYSFNINRSLRPAPIAAAIDFSITLLLYASTLGLLRWPRLFVAALGGLWVHALLFAEVYPGFYRHQGLWIVYLLTLYWLAAHRADTRLIVSGSVRRLSDFGRRIGLPALLALNLVIGAKTVWLEVTRDQSAIPALAATLRATPGLERAIVIAEPDYYLEALPYYASNPTYLLREGKFGDTTTWTRHARLDLGLSDILERARTLETVHDRPVVILIAHRIDTLCAQQEHKEYGHHWMFHCNPRDLQEFHAATQVLAPSTGAIHEDFAAFVLN